ncbi:MAG: hypothetical protein AAGJ52_00935 [Pseudomonadota bacterium]
MLRGSRFLIALMAAAASLLGLILVPVSAQANPGACQAEAREQARELLTFHVGEDDRIAIRDEVLSLGQEPNPAAPEEPLETLEVWGDIYKGQYRMRFQYAHIYDSCLLMGQEILEFANLGLSTAEVTQMEASTLEGRILALHTGDRACYVWLETEDGERIERPAVMTLCEDERLIGQTRVMEREWRPVMAASCEGDPECSDTDWLELIVAAVPE